MRPQKRVWSDASVCPCRTRDRLNVDMGTSIKSIVLRVVAITRLFPNSAEPLWCLFNKQRLAALGRLDDVEVLGVIPWFPGARAARRWSAAGRLSDVPATETIDGLQVAHPRYLLAPKLPSLSAGADVGPLVAGAWVGRQAAVRPRAGAAPD